MTLARFSKIRQERGDALIEALIGVLLMSVVALGLSHATARAMVGMRNVNTQNIVVTAVRDALSQSTSLLTYCSASTGPTVQIAETSLTLNVLCTQNTATEVSVAVVGSSGSGSGGGSTSANGHGSSEGSNSAPATTLSYSLPANRIVTSMSVSLPANTTSASFIGGDGSMQVAF